MKITANVHNARGNKYLDERTNLDQAAKHFLDAIKVDKNWSVPWYNLGLVYKLQKNWPESLQCNLQATKLNSKDEAAWWNLGIAASAIGDWKNARFAWKSYGIPIPEGEGEPVRNFGPTPIRLNPEASGEIVWCLRIDPARAIVKSVPLPDSKHRYGDLILHDGAPNGSRIFQGREIPVFDELALLQPSTYKTFRAFLRVQTYADFEELGQMSLKIDIGVDDWNMLRYICQDCSEGSPEP